MNYDSASASLCCHRFTNHSRKYLCYPPKQKQHGTVVTKIKPERAREERYLRYVLEKEALSYIPENAEKEDYRELYDNIAKQEKAIEEGNNIQFIELDNEFHHKQYKIAGCELFLDVVTTGSENIHGRYGGGYADCNLIRTV